MALEGVGSKYGFGGRRFQIWLWRAWETGQKRADGLHSACLRSVGSCSLSLAIYFVSGILVITLNILFTKDFYDDIELNKFLIVQAVAG